MTILDKIPFDLIDQGMLTVSLAPFFVNEPWLDDRHIEDVTDQREAFGAWW